MKHVLGNYAWVLEKCDLNERCKIVEQQCSLIVVCCNAVLVKMLSDKWAKLFGCVHVVESLWSCSFAVFVWLLSLVSVGCCVCVP